MRLEKQSKELADIVYNKTLFEIANQKESEVNSVLAKQGAFTAIAKIYEDATVKLATKRVESYLEVYKDPETFKLDLDEIIEDLSMIASNQAESLMRNHYFQFFGLAEKTEPGHESKIRKLYITKFNTLLSSPIADLRAAQMRLDINLLSSTKSKTIIHIQDFSFVADSKLREIVIRDYAELISLNVDTAKKSALTLSGSIIEGLVIDTLVNYGLYNFEQASNKVLKDLIADAVANGIIKDDRISNILRVFRNVIHPAREIRDNLKLTKEEAKHSIAAVDVIITQIRDWYTAKAVSITPSTT